MRKWWGRARAGAGAAAHQAGRVHCAERKNIKSKATTRLEQAVGDRVKGGAAHQHAQLAAWGGKQGGQ